VIRRFGRWLRRLQWREWWPVSVAGEGRRKVCKAERERGSAAHSLLEVFRRLLVMEMEVVKLVVKVLVAKGRSGERERGEKGSASSRNEGGSGFLVYFRPNFLLPQTMEIKSIYKQGKRDTLSLVVPNLGP